MFKLLKWTIFLPLTLLILCVLSDSVKEGVIKLFVAFVVFPLCIGGFILWIAAATVSEWGMPQVTIEHHKVLNSLRQCDDQIDDHQRIINRLTNSIDAGKGQIKKDTRKAAVEDLPMPRKDGANMSHQASDWFLKAPVEPFEENIFENTQAGYDEILTSSFKTFAEMEAAIALHQAEIDRLMAIRAPFYEKHLEFHKVRVQAQIEKCGEQMAEYQKSIREKMGNEYAAISAERPDTQKKF